MLLLQFLLCMQSFLLRFDFSFPHEYTDIFFQWIPIFSLSQALVFYFSGLYARLWRYTSLFDLYAILSAIITSFGLSFTVVIIKIGTLGYPRSVLLLYLLIECVFMRKTKIKTQEKRCIQSKNCSKSIYKN